MFADDANIFIRGDNLENSTQQIYCELKEVNNWFTVNLLSLNVKKTNYIIFGNKKTGLYLNINKLRNDNTYL